MNMVYHYSRVYTIFVHCMVDTMAISICAFCLLLRSYELIGIRCAPQSAAVASRMFKTVFGVRFECTHWIVV